MSAILFIDGINNLIDQTHPPRLYRDDIAPTLAQYINSGYRIYLRHPTNLKYELQHILPLWLLNSINIIDSRTELSQAPAGSIIVSQYSSPLFEKNYHSHQFFGMPHYGYNLNTIINSLPQKNIVICIDDVNTLSQLERPINVGGLDSFGKQVFAGNVAWQTFQQYFIGTDVCVIMLDFSTSEFAEFNIPEHIPRLRWNF